ncbi:MAG: hypothetical protein ACI8QC_003192 [Planctomycetota bacterium]|jgi:hypothetical protein
MRVVLWILALGLLAPWPGAARQTSASTEHGLGARLLGPVATLAASAEWVRFDAAVADGEFELAYLRAERALALDPLSPYGWVRLGSHMIFERGGALFEPDPQARVAWMQAGLEVLAEGAERSRARASLLVLRGQILGFFVAELAADPEEPLPWPGGTTAASVAALSDLEEAEALGHPLAAQRVHDVRHQATERASGR